MDSRDDRHLSRRLLLSGSAAFATVLAMPALIGRAAAQPAPPPLRNGEILGTPNFGLRIKNIAGLRPYRHNGIRIAPERIADDKYIIHNYGHGGAGITLSWGTARRVERILRDLPASVGWREELSVGIVGSGVAGLTVAHVLRASFPRIRLTIYSKDAIADTTSFKAGGQFAPAGMARVYSDRISELHALVQGSFNEIQKLKTAGKARSYGIAERFNYTITPNSSFSVGVPRSIIPQPNAGRLPFRDLQGTPGLEYQTMLVDPTILLPQLLKDARASRLTMVRRRAFASGDEIRALPHKVIINCTGLGSRTLFNDLDLSPIKGQIVLLKNPSNLKYFFSEGCELMGADATYLFCRSKDIVVGGTYQVGNADPVPNAAQCDRFLLRMRHIFAGNLTDCRTPGIV